MNNTFTPYVQSNFIASFDDKAPPPTQQQLQQQQNLLDHLAKETKSVKSIIRRSSFPLNNSFRHQLWSRVICFRCYLNFDELQRRSGSADITLYASASAAVASVKDSYSETSTTVPTITASASASPSDQNKRTTRKNISPALFSPPLSLSSIPAAPNCAFVHPLLQMNYYLNEIGIETLFHVLKTLQLEFASLTFAPFVYPMAALLLHYCSEAETNNLLRGLLTRGGFFTTSQHDWKVLTLSLDPLLKKYSKSTVQRIQLLSSSSTSPPSTANQSSQPPSHNNNNDNNNNLDFWNEIFHWPMLIWRLPIEHLIRIIDCFLYEGEKVLLRAAIVIYRLFFIQRMAKTKGGGGTGAGGENKKVNLWEELVAFVSQSSGPCPSQELLNQMFRLRTFSRRQIVRAKEQMQNTEFYNNFFTLFPQHANNRIAKHVAFQRNIHENPSELLSFDEWQALLEHIPERISSLMRPTRLYSTNVNGTSLKTLFELVDEHAFSLLCIQTIKGNVFGAFCADSWSGRHHAKQCYFGRGITFVFSIRPKFQIFHWVNLSEDRLSNLFMKADAHGLYIGGSTDSGGPAAIYLNENLANGNSSPSATFACPSLVSLDNSSQDFRVALVEIFAFENV